MNEISYYNTFALVSLIAFILLTIMAVFIWVKLDVKHYFAVLTGSEARKTIDKIKQDAESGEVQTDRRRRGNRAVISWNTSEGLANGGSDATMPLNTDPEKTTLLNPGNGQSQADPYATMVLDTINQQSAAGGSLNINGNADEQSGYISTPGFVVEKEIVNTAGNDNS